MNRLLLFFALTAFTLHSVPLDACENKSWFPQAKLSTFIATTTAVISSAVALASWWAWHSYTAILKGVTLAHASRQAHASLEKVLSHNDTLWADYYHNTDSDSATINATLNDLNTAAKKLKPTINLDNEISLYRTFYARREDHKQYCLACSSVDVESQKRLLVCSEFLAPHAHLKNKLEPLQANLKKKIAQTEHLFKDYPQLEAARTRLNNKRKLARSTGLASLATLTLSMQRVATQK